MKQQTKLITKLKRYVKKVYLTIIGLCVILSSLVLLWIWQGKRKDDINRRLLVQQSALYIYNHYEDVKTIQYDNFTVGSFGLGSHTYNFDITVNGRAEFELEMHWDYEISRGEEIAAWETQTNQMAEKTYPTKVKILPDEVELIDNTD